MKSIFNRKTLIISAVLLSLAVFAFVVNTNTNTNVNASHSWGNYHWARTSNPFNLKLDDNVSSAWDQYLGKTSSDWSTSTVFDTTIIGNQSNNNCRPTSGKVEVCSKAYGRNGWLGIAQIWVSGNHITQGTVKVNDTYFNTATYNTPAWRNLVMCQEVGHMFGLGHNDEIFTNLNNGTCMDYTNAPAGGIVGGFNYGASNERPNVHDYTQLETIYSHFDSTTTIKATDLSSGSLVNDLNDDVNMDNPSSFGKSIVSGGSLVNDLNDDVNIDNPSSFGKSIKKDSRGKNSLYERDLGKGEKLFTFVIWVE